MAALRTSAFLCLFGLILLTPSVSRSDDYFEKEVRPLLVRACIGCHGPEKQGRGLRLDSKSGWQTGGERGTAIVPGKPDASPIIKAIHGRDGFSRMPLNGKLTDHEISVLKKWVKNGAIDPRTNVPSVLGGMTLDETVNWWAFRPISRPAVPHGRFSNPVDAFIGEKLAQKNLSLSPIADRRTLLRRATYDLTGLPPTPEEVEAFLKDQSTDAFARVVERLLKSPHYGERWGRHWLDLVRYADTAGENSDHPLPHAWRYRNWVIDALNSDMPYDTFIREQIAGDLIAVHGPSEKYAARVVATGFLAIARRFDHDSDKSMHLTHEDGIDTIGKAILGLSLGCARCHDHKYDAISSRDYYALYGILESTRFAFPGCEAKQQPRDLVPLVPPAEWKRIVQPYLHKLASVDAAIKSSADLQRRHAQEVQAAFVKNRRPISQGEVADGKEMAFGESTSELQVNAGDMILLSVTPLKNHGADTTLVEFEVTEVGGQRRKWNATEDLLATAFEANPHADKHGHKQVWWFFDARNQPTLLHEHVLDLAGNKGLTAWRNGDTPSALINAAATEQSVWTKLPPKSLFVHPSPNGNVAVGWLSPISGKVRINGRIRDAHPGGPDGVGWVLEQFSIDVRKPLMAQAEAAAELRRLTVERTALAKSAPKQDVAYAVVDGKPADARMHLRGDPEKTGEVVPRRWLQVLGGTALKDKSSSGRLELAHWITSKGNPLTARVMVNRIWLHHFGKGIVKTPNDFGSRGIAPTHPELLDWLASEFVSSEWGLKTMHRIIMNSQTYQQSAEFREDASRTDASNNLYWRFERRRLSAEEIRDSLLAVSRQLDRKPAEAHPFPSESTWAYTQHVPFSTQFETDKRSVYLIQIRNRRHPFLGLFDGADPNSSTPVRQSTTVPTQALYFLNDAFFHAQAERIVERLLINPEADRANVLFETCLQRPPTVQERELTLEFVRKRKRKSPDVPDVESTKASWCAMARIILAGNEFLFVE